MKKTLLLLLVLFAINTAKSQITFSVGPEIGYSLHTDFGAMFGLSVRGEYELNEKMAITGQLGYSYVGVSDYDNSYAYNIPTLLGFKYSLDDQVAGMYAMGQLGIHAFGWNVNVLETDYGDNYIELGAGLGVGYLIGEHIDLYLHYNAIFGEDEDSDGNASLGTFGYISARIAYKF
jgi:hypothetical protein